jgi:hypothetical protein
MKNIKKTNSSLSHPKNAICILTYQPDERLIQLYDDLNKNYDYYVIVDDNEFDIQHLEKKYTSFHFVKIKEEDCKKKGYYGLNYYIKKGEPSAWEKAIYYFCEIKLNSYPFVWFLEDDVFIPQKNVISSIDRHYYGTGIDILCKSNETFTRKWSHAEAVLQYAPPFLTKYLHISLICAIRLSNTFLKKIKEYIEENKRMFFAESFFITLANYYHFMISRPKEFETIIFRKNWNIQDVIQFPNNIIHPIKNITQQVHFRNFFQSNIKYFIINETEKLKKELEKIHSTFLGFHFIQKIGFIHQQKYMIITQDNQDFYLETIDLLPNQSMFIDKIQIDSMDEGVRFALNVGYKFNFYQNMITENYTDKKENVSIKIVHIPSFVPFVQMESYSADKLDDFTGMIQNIGIKINSFFGLYEYNSQLFGTTIKPFTNHEFKKLEKSKKYIKKNKKLFEDLIHHQTTLYKNVIENLQNKNIIIKMKTSNNFINSY